LTIRKKILLAISICLFGFLVAHFSAVISTVSPREWNNDRVRFWSEAYIKPQFSQGWKVFAPVPKEDARLKYRFFTNGKWSDLRDLEAELAELRNPFSRRIAIKVGFYLGFEIRQNSTLNSDGTRNYRIVKASSPYSRAAFACFQHVKLNEGLTPDSMEIIVERALFPKFGFTEKKIIRDYLGAEAIK